MLDAIQNNIPEQTDDFGRFITTYSGEKFYIDHCNIADIPMFDIAHALSMNCRFNGHLQTFYSVAEHSVIVSEIVEAMASRKYALAALLHDISEAFVPDVPRPFKDLIAGFDDYEHRLLKAAAHTYKFRYPLHDTVKYVDKHIVRAEAEELYQKPCPKWVKAYDSIPMANRLIEGLTPWEARQAFMVRFATLMYDA